MAQKQLFLITPSSPPERYKNPLDYVLVAGTCVLFVIYLPLFKVARELSKGMESRDPSWFVDLIWFLPFALMLSCMLGLFSWAVQGATNVLRVLWFLALSLAGVGALVAYPVVMMMGMVNPTQHHHARPRAAPQPVPVEPPLPVPPLERP